MAQEQPERLFEPAPFQIVRDPQQLKAFSDPIRNRVLHLLTDREATNQQLAALLKEPQAKVLYHVRFLLGVELITLVREQIKGGNVEKYYRATAKMYGLRPDPGDFGSISAPIFESVAQELAACENQWPDLLPSWELRRLRLPSERVEEFQQRLLDLIAEYWGGPEAQVPDDPSSPAMAFAAVTYRYPVVDDGA